MTGQTWALVLAAGDGNRLRSLTTDRDGTAVPKQFCSLDGGPSLLELGLERASRVVPRSRIACVVAAQHRRWWRDELSRLRIPPQNVVEQPQNRGTAPGVLLPLFRILEQDPDARVVFLPSDHFVSDENVLTRVLRRALEVIERGSRSLFLLGITPDEPDSGFGWIVPAEADGRSIYHVNRFVEKPPPALAADLMCRGGVWNSFIIASSGMALLAMFQRRMPREVSRIRQALREGHPQALDEVYLELRTRDFCADVLQGEEDDLRVLPVPHCGWSDLGTPERVACCLDRSRPAIARHNAAWAVDLDLNPSRGNAGPILSASLSRVMTTRLAKAASEGAAAQENPLGAARGERTIPVQLARAAR